MKYFTALRLLLCIILLYPHSLLNAQAPSTCFEIESILVDACGSPEGENEMVRFIVGANDLNTSNLNVTWPNNNFLGICQGVQSAANVAALNATIQACGYIVEPVSGVLPAGKEVIMVTSENMNPSFNSFANLADTIYMIFQCTGNTSGHFKNYSSGSGTRTLVMDFGVSCSDTVTYNADSLVDQAGVHAAQDGATANFTDAGLDSYSNSGCQAPIVPLSATVTSTSNNICPGDSVLLNAVINSGSPHAYFWTGGNGTFSNSNNLSTTYYSSNTYTGIDFIIFGIIGNCNDTVYDTLALQINNGASLVINASGPYTFCMGDSVVVTASGPGNYLWSTGETTASVTLNSSGTYYITASGACGNVSDSVVVTVLNTNQSTLSASGPTSFCQGDSVTLSVINGGTGFLWSDGTTTSSITVLNNGTYSVTVTSSCGNVTLSQQVTVTNSPAVTISTTGTIICSGEAITMTANGGNSYSWSDGTTASTLITNTPGTYTVTGSNACGNDTASVILLKSPIDVTFVADTTSGYSPLSVQFTNQSTNAITYSWHFADGGTSYDIDPSHTFINSGTYLVSLIGQDANGCSDTAFLTILVLEDTTNLFIPNIFTPNGDSFNPYFNVKGTGIKSVSGTIYSRWGNEVASWNSLNNGWDGKTKNGHEVPEGVYFFTLSVVFNNGKSVNKNGQVTLVR